MIAYKPRIILGQFVNNMKMAESYLKCLRDLVDLKVMRRHVTNCTSVTHASLYVRFSFLSAVSFPSDQISASTGIIRPLKSRKQIVITEPFSWYVVPGREINMF